MNTILELNPLFPVRLAPDGILILSGILTGQTDRIVEDLKRHGLTKTGETVMGEWACLIVKKV
jgi:ribosomal protein L11 methylase PrmA